MTSSSLTAVARHALGLFLLLAIALAGCGDDRESTDPGASRDAFDLPLSTELSLLSLQSYHQLEDFEAGRPFVLPAPYTLEAEYTTRQGYEGDFFSESEDRTVAFVASSGDALYVIFRGTQTVAEWVSNITYSQVNNPFIDDGGKLHRGFTRVYQSIRDELLTTLALRVETGAFGRLYVTGHSLGGALATLSAMDLQERTGLDTVVYNFAAPRAGGPTFRERFGERIPTSWRVFNTRDLVPDLPPRSVLAFEDLIPEEVFYAHTKTEYPLTYGATVDSIFDFEDLENAHDLCRLRNQLCDQGTDPEGCRAAAASVAGCNES